VRGADHERLFELQKVSGIAEWRGKWVNLSMGRIMRMGSQIYKHIEKTRRLLICFSNFVCDLGDVCWLSVNTDVCGTAVWMKH